LPVHALAIVLVGMLVLGLAVYLVVRARIPGKTRRDALSIMTVLGGQIALGFVIVGGISTLAGLRGKQLDSVSHRSQLGVPVDEALARTRIALLRAGLTIDVEQLAEVVDARSGEQYAEVLVLRAATASPFDRWELGWAGPVRRSPQIWIDAVQRRGDPHTAIQMRAGLYPPGSTEAREAAELLESIDRWMTASE
jgi:hypothetical protein